jgi:hypothetical protein
MPSCALIPPTLDCSDLQIGEELGVVIGEPVYAGESCGAEFGVIPGAEIRLDVEAHGETGGCNSMIGSTVIPGVELTYDPQGSLMQSGGDPLASESNVTDEGCEGDLILLLRHDQSPSVDLPNVFSRLYIGYRWVRGTNCPNSCGGEYNVQVTRM